MYILYDLFTCLCVVVFFPPKEQIYSLGYLFGKQVFNEFVF